MSEHKPKIIISGGGTGGHIFPAIAIANAIKTRIPDADILFVGAHGKMEMDKVPQAGYKIIGLPIRGFQRKISLSVFAFFIRLFVSMIKARRIVKKFSPDVAIGVGGYASGPLLKAATKLKVKTLIQEQNSYAGVTNKLLGNHVHKVCVAYEQMDRFFPKDKIVFTGNPVRKDFADLNGKKDEAKAFFGIKTSRTLFVTGGSLGARTINEAMFKHIESFRDVDITVLWQTGKYYHQEMQQRMDALDMPNVQLMDFVSRMDLAYAVADVIVARAGALTCAELALTAKPAILIPSPNVAEDHQTKNANAFVDKDAAIMVADSEALDELGPVSLSLVNDEPKQRLLAENMHKLAVKNADERIVDQVIKLISE